MRLLILSGGSKGLGSAICDQYSKRGYTIVEFSRSAPHTYSVRTDLSSEKEVANSISNSLRPLASEEWREIVVINNAGTLIPIGVASKKEIVSVRNNININFTSGLVFMIEALKQFQGHAGKKTLVNISSGAALKGYPGWSLYCAAKAGVENFIRSIAQEQETEEHPFIAINVDPGLIDTDMQASIRESNIEDFPAIDRFIQRKKSGLLRPPEEVASAVLDIINQSSIENGQRYDVQ